jgi:hypothetical protein
MSFFLFDKLKITFIRLPNILKSIKSIFVIGKNNHEHTTIH